MVNQAGSSRLLESAEEQAYRIAAVLIIVGFIAGVVALLAFSETIGALAVGLILVGAGVAIGKIILESER